MCLWIHAISFTLTTMQNKINAVRFLCILCAHGFTWFHHRCKKCSTLMLSSVFTEQAFVQANGNEWRSIKGTVSKLAQWFLFRCTNAAVVQAYNLGSPPNVYEVKLSLIKWDTTTQEQWTTSYLNKLARILWCMHKLWNDVPVHCALALIVTQNDCHMVRQFVQPSNMAVRGCTAPIQCKRDTLTLVFLLHKIPYSFIHHQENLTLLTSLF